MSQRPFTAAALRGAVDLSALKRPPASAAGARGPGGPAPAAPAGGGTGQAGSSGGSAGGAADALVVTATDATFQEVANASVRVPVVVVLWSARLPESGSFVGVVADVARANGGRFQVASVDVDTNPGLLRAFQIQAVPAAVGLIQGQPVPLFAGVLSAAEVQPWIDELLKLAVRYGVTGRVSVDSGAAGGPGGAGGDTADAGEPAEPELPAHVAAAYDAIERGDLPAAAAAYEQALAADPRDEESALGLAQVQLLQRTQGADLAAARAAAAADPLDVPAQLLAADLDVLGGHVEDAFARLVDTVGATSGDERNTVREHLLGLFAVVGAADPRVVAARRALMSALF